MANPAKLAAPLGPEAASSRQRHLTLVWRRDQSRQSGTAGPHIVREEFRRAIDVERLRQTFAMAEARLVGHVKLEIRRYATRARQLGDDVGAVAISVKSQFTVSRISRLVCGGENEGFVLNCEPFVSDVSNIRSADAPSAAYAIRLN